MRERGETQIREADKDAGRGELKRKKTRNNIQYVLYNTIYDVYIFM